RPGPAVLTPPRVREGGSPAPGRASRPACPAAPPPAAARRGGGCRGAPGGRGGGGGGRGAQGWQRLPRHHELALLTIERLALEQRRGDPVELVAVVGEDVSRVLVCFAEQ